MCHVLPGRLCLVLLLAWTLVWPPQVRADLFTDARAATGLTLGQADTSGVSLRGGVGLRTYLAETSTTLFQTQATVGGSCGAFDLGASLTQAFATIPDLFTELIQSLLGSMPMLVLCYTSPSLCDLAKHFQSLTNVLLQARFGQCQTLQTSMAAAGLKLRSGQAARCLEAEQQRGTALTVALDRCLGQVSQLRNPFGLQSGRVELVHDTLEAAGVDAETAALAQQLLGEVTLTAGGRVFGTQQQRPPESLHRRYEQFQQTLVRQLREAAATLAAGGTVPDQLLQDLSLPGQPLPRAALDALATLQTDPVRSEPLLHQLAAGLALTRLTWEVGELHTTLAAAATVNAHLTDAECRLLERRLAALQQELDRVRQEKEVAERHLLPVIDALLAEQAAVQAEAAQVGLQAPSPEAPPTPFGGQLSVGFGY
jgi:hypothetical protein